MLNTVLYWKLMIAGTCQMRMTSEIFSAMPIYLNFIYFMYCLIFIEGAR